jgi:hypothetical protein
MRTKRLFGIDFMHRIGLALTLVFLPLLAQAQMYKWVDENGHTQYSDRPPPSGVKSEQITKGRTPGTAPAAPAQPAAAAPAGKSNAARELEFRKRQLSREEQQKDDEKKQKEQQAKQENCDIAQARLKSLEDGGRIIKPSTTGEREYMSSDEIEAEKIPARKKAEEACKK